MLNNFSRQEVLRYSRHLMMPDVGLEGQLKLKTASVLMVGGGGLGAPIGLYLAAAGIGHIGIVDYDRVDMSNLQRQVIHGMSTLNELKVESARQRMLDINPDIQVDIYPEPFTSANARDIARNYQIIVDGTDNFPTRYLINDLCVLTHKPFVYGAVYRFEGQSSVFDAQRGPCYRCLFSQPPSAEMAPTCGDIGVLGVMPGLVGMIQATETIKLILGIGEPMIGKMMLIDAMSASFQTVQIQKNPHCPICGSQPVITDLIDYVEFCGVPFPGGQPHQASIPEITPTELAQRLAREDTLQLIDVRQTVEKQISDLPHAVNIPLDELSHGLGQLDSDKDMVVFCRTGGRSALAQSMLMKAGFTRVLNLRGGINAWAREVDPNVWQY